jgi:hypothetical protein
MDSLRYWMKKNVFKGNKSTQFSLSLSERGKISLSPRFCWFIVSFFPVLSGVVFSQSQKCNFELILTDFLDLKNFKLFIDRLSPKFQLKEREKLQHSAICRKENICIHSLAPLQKWFIKKNN